MVMAHTFDRNCILIHAKAPSNLFCCVHPCHTDQHILLGFSLRYSNLGIRSDFIYNSSIKVGLAHDPPSLAPVSKHHSQSRVNISLSQHEHPLLQTTSYDKESRSTEATEAVLQAKTRFCCRSSKWRPYQSPIFIFIA